jgi:hypothetical protein
MASITYIIICVEIKPFVLWELPDAEAHLCPVRAMGEYIQASSLTSGYVFRKFASDDRLFANDEAMVRLLKPILSVQCFISIHLELRDVS